MKFATKLTVLFSALFLILCAFITHIVTSSSGEILETTISNQMESRALGKMDRIDKVLFERSMDMKMLASESPFRSTNPSPKLVLERLEELWKSSDSYISLSYFDMSRKRIVDTLGQDVGKIHPPSKYWPEIESGKDRVIGMYISESLKIPLFHVAVAAKDGNGARTGVFVGRMTVDWLSEIIKPVSLIQPYDKKMEKEGLMGMELVDGNGLIIYSNYNPENILKKTSDYWEYLKADAGRGNMSKKYRLRLPGREEEIVTFGREKGYRDYKGNGWILILHMPAKVVFAPVAELRNRLFISMAVIGGFSILAILLFARTVSRPIARLSNAVREVGKGNMDVNVWVDSKDEMWALAKNINAMAKNLSSSRTALEKARTESDEAHRLLERFFLLLPDLVCIAGMDGYYKKINQAFTQTLGYGEQELLEKPYIGFIHPDDREAAIRDIERQFRGETAITFENRFLCKDGSYKRLSWKTVAVEAGPGRERQLYAVGRDITERNRMEETIRQNEARYREVFENAGDYIYSHNMDGIFTSVNRALCERCGYRAEELDGAPISKIVHPASLGKAHAMTEAKLKGESPYTRYELEIITRNGEIIPVELNTWLIISNGQPAGVQGIGRDIGERKRAEENLKASKEAAETATQLKDKFVTLVSHDLKEPLGAMIGFLKILKKDLGDADAGKIKLLESSIRSGENMAALINDILNVSRIKSGRITPMQVFTDIHFLSVKIIADLADLAERKGITLVNRLPKEARMYADPELLGQVLQNLISNAIKFCHRGGTVAIFMPEGEPSTIAVSDTGVGISHDRFGTLFKYEEKTSTTGTAGEKGTGFGLPLSNDIIAAHGGSLAVESTPGKGSTFSIRLPGAAGQASAGGGWPASPFLQ